MKRWHGSGTIGILAAKLKAEGPIVKERLSLAVDVRRSYVDAFLKIIPQYRTTVMNFYDISAKIRYRHNESHLIDGSFFFSRDNMAVSDLMVLNWGNLGASLNWRAAASDQLTFNTTASLNHYNPRMGIDMMAHQETMWTYIHDYSLNEKIQLTLTDNHSLEFGLRSELFRVKSAEWKINDVKALEIRSLWGNSLWAEYAGSFSERLDIVAGLRFDAATVPAGHRFHEFVDPYSAPNQFDGKTYLSIEPRVSLKYSFSPFHSIKCGYGVSTQYLHSLRATTTTFPFDRCALTSADVRPEHSIQYGIGYNGMTAEGSYDWSAEGFYRRLNGVYDFIDGKGPFSNIALESIILGGEGRSYGLELMVRKNTGRLTGWVSYTLSHTQTKIPGINDGQWYNASNDRRHDFTVTGIFRLTDRWDLSASWIFLSGQPLTVPDVKYEVAG